jgi:hypothetical protein
MSYIYDIRSLSVKTHWSKISYIGNTCYIIVISVAELKFTLEQATKTQRGVEV